MSLEASLAAVGFKEHDLVDYLETNFNYSKFYSVIGQCLISLNPYPIFSFKFSDFFSDPLLLQKFSNQVADPSIPFSHIFKVTENLRRIASDGSSSQVLIFRGCSGSGKSEAFKLALQYLVCCDSMKKDVVSCSDVNLFQPLGSSANPFNVPSDVSRSGKAIAVMSLILDSFGTAVTDKNRYSTRHFKQVRIFYTHGKMIGFKVRSFATELLRCGPKDPVHSGAYILSLLCAGIGRRADEFKINSSQKESYLTPANANYDPLDLLLEFQHVQSTILGSGVVTTEEWDNVLRVLAACINLQCLAMVGAESTIISSGTKGNVGNVEALLGLPAGTVGQLLLKRADDRIGKPAGSLIDNKPVESRAIADSLTNVLMVRAFDFLLRQCSLKSFGDLPSFEKAGGVGSNALHLLDTPGWERYDSGACYIQQFLVNFGEEKFHSLYMETVFANEIARFGAEGVQLPPVRFTSMEQYLDLFDKAPTGLIQSLDEAAQAARIDDKAFLDKIMMNHGKNDPKLVRPGGAKFKATVFTVRHTFSDVSYDADNFVITNKMNSLPATALAMLASSPISFVAADVNAAASATAAVGGGAPPPPGAPAAAPGGPGAPPPPAAPPGKRVNDKSAVLAGYLMNKNNAAFNSVMSQIAKLGTSYVLCIATTQNKQDDPAASKMNLSNPQGNMANKTFHREFVMNQLSFFNVDSLLTLTKSGFSYVKEYAEFYNRFRVLQPFDNPTLPYSITTGGGNGQGLCKMLIQQILLTHKLAVNPDADMPVYGKSSIFLRDVLSGKLEEVRYQYIELTTKSVKLIQSIYRMWKKCKKFRTLRKGVVKLQSSLRCNLARGLYLAKRYAVTKLSAFIRMRSLSRYHRKLKASVSIIKSKMLGAMIQRIRYKKLLKASHMFQCIARGFNVRKSANNTFEAVKLLQRCAKSFLARKHRAEAVLKATRLIQKLYRGFKARQRNKSLVAVLVMRREQRVATRVVKKIQSIWRGKLITVRFNEVVKATLTLQRWLMTRVQCRKFNLTLKLVRWLQGVARRLIAVNKANTIRVTNMVSEEKGILTELYTRELNSITSLPLSERMVGSGLHTGKGLINRLEKYLVTFDVNFDLNFAYPEGWCNTLIQFTKKLKAERKEIVKIILGAQFTVIIDDLSNVYSMGLGDVGQLGHNNRQSYPQPRLMEKLPQHLALTELSVSTTMKVAPSAVGQKIVVKDVCCGRDHSLLLTGTGRVYSWGDNKRGQLGHSKFEASPVPKLVGDEHLKRAKHISCGAYHSCCIVEPGLLYTWGAAECLGRISDDSKKYKLSSATTSMTAAGYIITGTSTVGSKGLISGNDSQFRNKDSCDPDVLPFFTKKRVFYACCGENHITVKTATDLYSWGSNNQGQLGNGTTDISFLPVQVLMKPLSEQVMSGALLFSGGRHMALVANGDIWLWGWNKYGQIGNGTLENVLKPTQITLTSAAAAAAAVSGGNKAATSGTTAKPPAPSVAAAGAASSRPPPPGPPPGKTGAAPPPHPPPPGPPGGKSPPPPPPAAPSGAAPTSPKPKDKASTATPAATPAKSPTKSSHKPQSMYVKSVNVGWRHVVVLTGGNQLYGWGMLNLPNNSSKLAPPEEVPELTAKESRRASLNMFNQVIATSDCYLTPTILNGILNTEAYIENDSGTFLSLSGCSSSSLSVLCLDTVVYTPLHGLTGGDKTHKTGVPSGTCHADTSLSSIKSITAFAGDSSSAHPENSHPDNSFHSGKATSVTPAKKDFNRRYKAVELEHNVEFHIDQGEFKKKLKEKLGGGIYMGTVAKKTTPSSKERRGSLTDLPRTTKTVSPMNDSMRRKSGSRESAMRSHEKMAALAKRDLRAREGDIRDDALLNLFSPTYLKNIRGVRENKEQVAEEEAEVAEVEAKTRQLGLSRLSYGIGMPKSDKAFLAHFAATHSPEKQQQQQKAHSKPNSRASTSFAPSQQQHQQHHTLTGEMESLSYSARLAARRASMDTSGATSGGTGVNMTFQERATKRLSFRSSTSDSIAARRLSMDELQSRRASARNSMAFKPDPVVSLDHTGLDSAIEKLKGDLQGMKGKGGVTGTTSGKTGSNPSSRNNSPTKHAAAMQQQQHSPVGRDGGLSFANADSSKAGGSSPVKSSSTSPIRIGAAGSSGVVKPKKVFNSKLASGEAANNLNYGLSVGHRK